MTSVRTSVAIIGAGPYGLSLADHLAALGIKHRIFGRTMGFWEQIAAAGEKRFLKSFCFGTNLSSPTPGRTFADYNRPRGLETFEPCSMANFADYGRWFQAQAVPWVEEVKVANVRREGGGFLLQLADGTECFAGHVVVATGLSMCQNLPGALASLGPAQLSHTADIARFADFAGRKVAVVGAGQSALEAAALLHEVGARPRLFVRDDVLLWHERVPLARSLWRRVRSPLSALGSGPNNWWLTRFPGALWHAPDCLRTAFLRRHLPPAGAWWLRDRVEGIVPIELGVRVVGAKGDDKGIELQLQGKTAGQEQSWRGDHVVAGTGYTMDVDRLAFLDKGLRAGVARLQGAPRLDRRFQSSQSGLYFVGPMSMMSFGPLYRFVAGAEYTVRVLSAHLARAGAAP